MRSRSRCSVQARIPAHLRPGQAAPRRAQRGHRGVHGGPVPGRSAGRDRQEADDPEGRPGRHRRLCDLLPGPGPPRDATTSSLAERMFRQVLDAVPDPQQNDRGPIVHYAMFRWGANNILGRIEEARHNDRAAIDYYSRPNPTPEQIGNWLRGAGAPLGQPVQQVIVGSRHACDRRTNFPDRKRGEPRPWPDRRPVVQFLARRNVPFRAHSNRPFPADPPNRPSPTDPRRPHQPPPSPLAAVAKGARPRHFHRLYW